MCGGAPYSEPGFLDEPTSTKEPAMINHPNITRQLVTTHQQDLLADADRHRRVRECRTASRRTADGPRRRLSPGVPRLVWANPRTA
jgi:hypothetical protein